MASKYCYTCKKTKSPLDFNEGKRTCKGCQSEKDRERRNGKKGEVFENVICGEIGALYNCEIKPKHLPHPTHKKEMAFSRGLCMIYRHKIMKQSQVKAASMYSRDHAALINMRKKLNDMNDTDKDFRDTLMSIETKLNVKLL